MFIRRARVRLKSSPTNLEYHAFCSCDSGLLIGVGSGTCLCWEHRCRKGGQEALGFMRTAGYGGIALLEVIVRPLSIVNWAGSGYQVGFRLRENTRTRLSQRFCVWTAKAGRSVTMPLTIRMFMLLSYWCSVFDTKSLLRRLFRGSKCFPHSDGEPFPHCLHVSSDSITGSDDRTIMKQCNSFSACMLHCWIIISLLPYPARQLLLSLCVVLDAPPELTKPGSRKVASDSSLS